MSAPSKAAQREAQKLPAVEDLVEEMQQAASKLVKQYKVPDIPPQIVALGMSHATELISNWVRANAFTLYDEWKAAGCPNTWPEHLANAIDLGRWLERSED